MRIRRAIGLAVATGLVAAGVALAGVGAHTQASGTTTISHHTGTSSVLAKQKQPP